MLLLSSSFVALIILCLIILYLPLLHRKLSDVEYLQFLEAEEGGRVGGPVPSPVGGLPSASNRANPGVAAACLEVLSAALVVLKDTQHERMRSRLGLLMAEEHMVAGNMSAARKLLLQICHAYRKYAAGTCGFDPLVLFLELAGAGISSLCCFLFALCYSLFA